MNNVVIIGGGITGLTAAWHLNKQNPSLRITLLEEKQQPGGKIRTVHDQLFTIDGGPDSFITQKPWGIELCRELGIEDRMLPCNQDRQQASILYRGRLVPLPSGFRFSIPTRIMPLVRTPLFSASGKLRMMMEPFVPPKQSDEDESVAEFMRRRFGREAADRLAGPLMAGIYVSDPERLSLPATFSQFAEIERKHGSLIKAARKAVRIGLGDKSGSQPSGQAMFMSLQNGMAELVKALLNRMSGTIIKTGMKARRIECSGGKFIVHAGSEQFTADHVVLAIPAHTASYLIDPLNPECSRLMNQIRFVSTATVALGYKDPFEGRVPPITGFGFVVPESEKRDILACTWSSNKFNARAPDKHDLFRMFMGGPWREDNAHRSDKDLIDLGRSELNELLGIRKKPVIRTIFRWPRANPQYDVGHRDIVTSIEEQLHTFRGLHIAGSSYHGIGIPDCIRSARRAADRILDNVGMETPNNAAREKRTK